MKTLASIIGISLLLLLLVGGGCGFTAYTMIQDMLNNRFQGQSFQAQTFKWCTNGLPFVDQLPKILDNKRFLVLLQNNMELRPSGGFLGSYAVISTAPTGLQNIRIQDIYVPDGHLVGHVDPPRPIEQAFGQGWWKLRDSNWDPDFKIAAEQIAWFFDQGGEKSDGLIAVNRSLVQALLGIMGPVKTTDYPETITAANFYELAQKYAEQNFFPGSSQKRDFLGAVGRGVTSRLLAAGPITKIKIAKIIWWQLKQKQILVWFKDAELEKIAQVREWSGGLGQPKGDYLYIVETNLGANKANCCVQRAVVHEQNGFTEKLFIIWTNSSLFANPVQPVFWGGNYIDFVRVIVPASAKVQAVRVEPQDLQLTPELAWQIGLQENAYTIEKRGDLQIVGFWAQVPARKSQTVVIQYQLPPTKAILVRRQPGIGSLHYQLRRRGRIVFNGEISSDSVIAD